ncbi:G9 [Linum perenne]
MSRYIYNQMNTVVTLTSLLLCFMAITGTHGGGGDPQILDVTQFGAKSDDKTDISQALTEAWMKACETDQKGIISRIVIPRGKYVMGMVGMEGPCKSAIEVQIDGYVKTPPTGLRGLSWITFSGLSNLSVFGNGTLDGQGPLASIASGNRKNMPHLPLATNLRFESITNAILQGLTSKDSRNFHIDVSRSKNVTLRLLTLTAPSDSSGTTTVGIFLRRSHQVTISDTTIQTGDYCIHLSDGSQQVNVQNMKCGPGGRGGFLLGALGKSPDEEKVSDVTLLNSSFVSTANGIRIEAVPGTINVASNVHFNDITMDKVKNPISIDQHFCEDDDKSCEMEGKVTIKDFIPTKFLRKYGENLQNRVILKDPAGTQWPVELTNSEGELWLDKGFPEFADFYSISHGYLVVFQLQIRGDDDDHHDHDCFNVVVFDPCATEIDYPCSQQQQKKKKNLSISPSVVEEEETTSDSESDDVDTPETLNMLRNLSGKPRQSSEVDDISCPSSKVRRTTGSDAGECKKKEKKSCSSELGESSAPGKVGKLERGRLSHEEKREAIERARRAFTTTNPFFMLAVQPSYLNLMPNVAIPMSFAKQRLKNGSGEAILVRVSDGRKWKVKYRVKCDATAGTGTGRVKKMKAFFNGTGWKDFALGNQLAVGDVCAFELTNSTSDDHLVTFGVTIFRNYKHQQPWTWIST